MKIFLISCYPTHVLENISQRTGKNVIITFLLLCLEVSEAKNFSNKKQRRRRHYKRKIPLGEETR